VTVRAGQAKQVASADRTVVEVVSESIGTPCIPEDVSDLVTPPSDYEEPLINGRPCLTEVEVLGWCRAAHGPLINSASAAEICRLSNDALLQSPHWQDRYKEQRKTNPSQQRMDRVVQALRTLLADLPPVIAVSKDVGGDVTLIEALLDLIQKHRPLVEKHQPAPGRRASLEGTVATNIGKRIQSIWTAEHPDRAPSKAAVDDFVGQAMRWVGVPREVNALARTRRRRTQSTLINVRKE